MIYCYSYRTQKSINTIKMPVLYLHAVPSTVKPLFHRPLTPQYFQGSICLTMYLVTLLSSQCSLVSIWCPSAEFYGNIQYFPENKVSLKSFTTFLVEWPSCKTLPTKVSLKSGDASFHLRRFLGALSFP